MVSTRSIPKSFMKKGEIMIKAKDLVWEKYGTLYLRAKPNLKLVFPVSIYYLVSESYAWLEIKNICEEECYPMLWCAYPATLEEAKAACQAHYQSMAESMVDMGHLKELFYEIAELGFEAGCEWHRTKKVDPTTCVMEQLADKLEPFLKTLEQERKG